MPQQMFNVDERGLFWKCMSARTSISTEEKSAPELKASKGCLMLLLGGNATRDFKIKPVLVNHSENPSAMKGYVKPKLPVICRK